jgi:hypothetical protein
MDRGNHDTAERRKMLLDTAKQLRALKMGADEYGVPAPYAIMLDSDAFRLRTPEHQNESFQSGMDLLVISVDDVPNLVIGVIRAHPNRTAPSPSGPMRM